MSPGTRVRGVGVGAGGGVGIAGDGLGVGVGWKGFGMLEPPPQAVTTAQSKQVTVTAAIDKRMRDNFTTIVHNTLG